MQTESASAKPPTFVYFKLLQRCLSILCKFTLLQSEPNTYILIIYYSDLTYTMLSKFIA